jgi:hypothetical protein
MGTDMSVADLGSLGEFVSSLAVLFTLIFLTLQMRQNTKAVQASMASEMTSQWLTNANSAATSTALDDAQNRVLEAGTLQVQGGNQVFMYTAALLKTIEFAHFQWCEGNLDERLWKTNQSSILTIVGLVYFEELWTIQHDFYTDEFQAYVESLRSISSASATKSGDAFSKTEC